MKTRELLKYQIDTLISKIELKESIKHNREMFMLGKHVSEEEEVCQGIIDRVYKTLIANINITINDIEFMIKKLSKAEKMYLKIREDFIIKLSDYEGFKKFCEGLEISPEDREMLKKSFVEFEKMSPKERIKIAPLAKRLRDRAIAEFDKKYRPINADQ